MAVLGQNDCTPARIYGPLSQNIFCGCSVMSFSVSAGWNEQASSLTIELVEDPCSGPKVWWDSSLNRQSGEMADPGFTYPEPGVPAYFRIEENPDGSTEAERGGFEYAGLIEGWTEKKDPSGNPVYTVKMTDPRAVLENTQVIVNDYPGNTENVWNLINAYAFVESLGTDCDSSPVGAIGGVTNHNTVGNITNDRGMVWNDLKCAIHTLTATIAVDTLLETYNPYCRDNRLVYVGPALNEDGYGVMHRDDIITDSSFLLLENVNLNSCHYLVDITEIPFAPTYYRVSGPNVSLMEIISQVCKDAGCDYYIELLPIKDGGIVHKVIKVRAAVRQSQPQLGRLDDFIAAKQAQATEANGGVLSYVQGEELRDEETSIYVMGGKVRDGFEADSSQMLPFWGTDTDGNLIVAQVVNNEYQVKLDTKKLNGSLATPFTSQYNWITERELRAALMDFDSWVTVANHINNDFGQHLKTIGQKGIVMPVGVANALLGKIPVAALFRGLANAGNNDHQADADEAKDIEKIYEFVRTFADEFYGKQFLVNAPFVCVATDTETGRFRYSHEPSTEGCWIPDGTTEVVGLAHDSAASDFFRDELGKYQPILKFPLINASTMGGGGGALTADPSKLGEDSYLTDGVDEIWVKASVDSRMVSGTPLSPSSDTISFLLTIDAPVCSITSDDNDLIEAMAALDFLGGAVAGAKPRLKLIERGSVTMAAIHQALAPAEALVPRVSHVDVYGPWGVAGLPGQVHLETDEGFTPWEYGSDVVMNSAATDRVTDAVTQMRKGERGSIAVAGFPNIPLGAELFSVDTASPPTSQGLQKYVGTRTYSIEAGCSAWPYLYCGMNAWTGEFGPNVTNVNVQVGAEGFTTEYQFSTYTPQFGRFQKDNAERLKQIGQSRLQNMRNLRSRGLLKPNIDKFVANAKQKFIEKQLGKAARARRSPSHVVLGRYCIDSERPEVNAQSVSELSYSSQSDSVYDDLAIISWDGIFRPVSKAGDGDFSAFVSAAGQCAANKDMSDQSDPPIEEYTRLEVSTTYLDPLANPSDTLLTNRSDVPTSGHDVEIVGRGTVPPNSGWCIPESEAAGSGGYETDYRFPAFKGPIIIQQWGYDQCGKPIPNKADTEADAKAGTFTSTDLEDKFMDGWLQKPKTWPVAPLDLRLDRERGVWTTPQPPRPLHVSNTGTCLRDYKKSQVENGKTVYDANGSAVANPTVQAEWPWTINPPTGVGVFPIYYDNVDCEHYAFPINRLDVRVTGGATLRDIKQIHFNSGFVLMSSDVTESGCNNTVTISATGCYCPTGSSSDNCVYISSSATCGRSAVTAECVTGIVFGSGMAVTNNGNGTMNIGSPAKAEGSSFTSLCNRYAGTPVAKKYETLSFVGSLSTTVDGSDDCDVVVSGLSMKIGHTGVALNDLSCFGAQNASTADRMMFGTGFVLTSDGCDLIVNAQNLTISGYDEDTCLTTGVHSPKVVDFSPDFHVEGDHCGTATIRLSQTGTILTPKFMTCLEIDFSLEQYQWSWAQFGGFRSCNGTYWFDEILTGCTAGGGSCSPCTPMGS